MITDSNCYIWQGGEEEEPRESDPVVDDEEPNVPKILKKPSTKKRKKASFSLQFISANGPKHQVL